MPQNERPPESGSSPEVMDIRGAARYLHLSVDTLYRYACWGHIPAFKLGNRWRFRRSSLEKWMQELENGKK